MKDYEKNGILASFEKALPLIDDPRVNDRDFGMVYGALSISLESRISELKRGRIRSSGIEKELEQLASVINCFQSKINASKKEIMGRELMQAYKIFSAIH
ncbi:hypothetical protein [Microbulbifer taiwanensis]|uniref:Uncharacterized protein n=1 Tax=Microbulbifer taiwanensis TaxID=986746 RepID=A0ABW1YP22_9GAMM|nr:hypothetical protein [Microbulbifer taiwanensis]